MVYKKIVSILTLLIMTQHASFFAKKNAVDGKQAIVKGLNSGTQRVKRYQSSIVYQQDSTDLMHDVYRYDEIGEFEKTANFDLEAMNELKADYYEAIEKNYQAIIKALRIKFNEHPELNNRGMVKIYMYYVTNGIPIHTTITSNLVQDTKDCMLDMNSKASIDHFKHAYFKMAELRLKSFEFKRTTYDMEYTDQKYTVNTGTIIVLDYGIKHSTVIRNYTIGMLFNICLVYGIYSIVRDISKKIRG